MAITVNEAATAVYRSSLELAIAAARQHRADPAESTLDSPAIIDAFEEVRNKADSLLLRDEARVAQKAFMIADAQDAMAELAEVAEDINADVSQLDKPAKTAARLADTLPINQVADNIDFMTSTLTEFKGKLEVLEDAGSRSNELKAFKDIFDYLKDFKKKVREHRKQEQDQQGQQ